jgi:hypothetical protein
MGLIPSDVADANGYQLNVAGPFVKFVNGVVGAKSSPI